jgi:type IV secretion system protein VirB10
MSDDSHTEIPEEMPGDAPAEPDYELTAEEATGFEKTSPATPAAFFNRKRVMIVLSIGFSVVVGGGLLFNILRDDKKTDEVSGAARAGRQAPDFLRSQRDRAMTGREDAVPEELPAVEVPAPGGVDALTSPVPVNARTPPPPAGGSGPGGAGGAAAARSDPLLAAYASPLVPHIEGSLFTSGTSQTQTGYPPGTASDGYLRLAREAARAGAASPPAAGYAAADPYRSQNAQDDKQAFYGQQPGGAAGGGGVSAVSGSFIGGNSLWIGTIIPGILITGINTDLPGEIIARVTAHVYDSQTGEVLLIPQGSLLVARYNSSVSYAQHRVQIAWDTLIRPDGFLLDLGGMNGIDKKGLSGQEATYHENWFEYLKAAGIITMFSVANARMTEEAAKYADESTAAGVARANAGFVNQTGSNIVSRAMNIQPTLTVESGTLVNIMLNKNLFLPPLAPPPETGRYILE